MVETSMICLSLRLYKYRRLKQQDEDFKALLVQQLELKNTSKMYFWSNLKDCNHNLQINVV